MPKTKAVRGDKVVRGGPLAQDILSHQEGNVRTSARKKKSRERKEGDDEYVASDLSMKILSGAREQQLELEEEHGITEPEPSHRRPGVLGNGKLLLSSKDDDDDDDEITEITEEEHKASLAEGMLGSVEVSQEEEKAFGKFMAKKSHRTLADIIQSKLAEKKTEIESVMSDGPRIQDLDPRIRKIYTDTAEYMKKYRSGKLPQCIKKLPYYQYWEQYLYLSRPDEWSAASMNAVTRIFCSNLPGHLAQRFYTLFLLPRIRDDIAEYKQLNFHLMQALKKSLFKTAAFFKGIVFPLIEPGNCTLKEALIICSVIREHSIPVNHSGAAIDHICHMEYTGASSLFLRTLLDKKYSLSYKVVDTVCEHFMRFLTDERTMPVLWHQALLTFAQRYKGDISQTQKKQLYRLLHVHYHPEITPEVRRELESEVSKRE